MFDEKWCEWWSAQWNSQNFNLFNVVVNWDGVLKSGSRLEGDHATHLWGWIERPIA